ncbi:hypothetical protein SLEP1_g14885 [Rubroshorea leprosula]|uniref:Uncharacterized protein n=1 Tax=Rubroshorea leprosula TaxID=152421 RepID=A0AAV5IRH8_9ROSI|nr:hypothetical protein SLEP1_g14885 [Rubroshorea leprosula]
MMTQLLDAQFIHTDRDANCVVNCLAKKGPYLHSAFVLYEHCPAHVCYLTFCTVMLLGMTT